MKAALSSSRMRQISSILSHSSGWQAVGKVHGDAETLSNARSLASRPRIPFKDRRICPEAEQAPGGSVADGQGSVSRVRHGPNLAFKSLNHTGLGESTKSIVLASLLGDSTLHIANGENDARLLFRVDEKDEEYFRWKAAVLEEVASLNSVHLGASRKFLFRSRAVAPLTRIFEVTHNHEELLIRKRWLSHLTPLSLAVWWCDAGFLVSSGRKGELSTDPFSEDRVMVLSKYLEDEWKVHAHVAQVKSRSEGFVYRLTLRTEELKKLLRLILPHIPVASMLRKCLVVSHSPALQESWISEMKTALPHFATYIDEELLETSK